MDPDETLKQLIDAAVTGNAAGLREAADNLAAWLARGGFAPVDPRQED